MIDELHLELVVMTAEEVTAKRRSIERAFVTRLPVSDYERGLYLAEGKEPPTS